MARIFSRSARRLANCRLGGLRFGLCGGHALVARGDALAEVLLGAGADVGHGLGLGACGGRVGVVGLLEEGGGVAAGGLGVEAALAGGVLDGLVAFLLGLAFFEAAADVLAGLGGGALGAAGGLTVLGGLSGLLGGLGALGGEGGLALGLGLGAGLDLEAAGDLAVDEDDVAFARDGVGAFDVAAVDEERAGLDALGGALLAEELRGHVGDALRGRGPSGAKQRRDRENPFQHRTSLVCGGAAAPPVKTKAPSRRIASSSGSPGHSGDGPSPRFRVRLRAPFRRGLRAILKTCRPEKHQPIRV